MQRCLRLDPTHRRLSGVSLEQWDGAVTCGSKHTLRCRVRHHPSVSRTLWGQPAAAGRGSWASAEGRPQPKAGPSGEHQTRVPGSPGTEPPEAHAAGHLVPLGTQQQLPGPEGCTQPQKGTGTKNMMARSCPLPGDRASYSTLVPGVGGRGRGHRGPWELLEKCREAF